MVEIISNRNCIYQVAYHVIWCPQYRHNILTGEVATVMSEALDNICLENEWPILTKEIQPDHVHLFLSIPPAISVANAVKVLKGVSARKLFLQFPFLRKRLWDGSLWSPSYYVGTAGNVSAETIRLYIERSEHVTKRR